MRISPDYYTTTEEIILCGIIFFQMLVLAYLTREIIRLDKNLPKMRRRKPRPPAEGQTEP